MKKEYQSKLSGYIQFSMASSQTSFITYNKVRLYYAKFEKQTFATLAEQYKKITGEDLALNINGMALEQDLLIQQVIKTQEEEKVFEYLLEQSKQGELQLPRAYWLAFNTIVFRIIRSGKYQEKLPIQKSKIDTSCTQSKKVEIPYLVYWVDDNPKNNADFIRKYLDPANIMTVQVQSTEQMIARLQHQYKIYKEKGTNILFISDMSRKEGDYMNQTAGIDLFKHIYHDLKLEEASIAYVGSRQYSLKSMAERKLKMDAISVVDAQGQLVSLIYQHFNLKKKK